MNITPLLRENIRNLKPYSSARGEFEGDAKIFLDANESSTPMGTLPKGINRYPDPLQKQLKELLARVKGVNPSQVFIGNGSDEAVDILFRCFCNPKTDNVVVFPPTYGMYEVCAAINDIAVIASPLDENFSIDLKDFKSKVNANTKLVFICNPNNPTGNCQQRETIEAIVKSVNGIVVVDEAYIDFCPEQSVVSLLPANPNLVVLQTLSKAWGLAGARVGLALASPEIIGVMNNVKFPYNIGMPSINIAEKALRQKGELPRRIEKTVEQRQLLTSALAKLPLVEKVYPSQANFLLIKTTNAKKIYEALKAEGVVVRDRSNQPGCTNCLRITVESPKENRYLLKVFKSINKMQQ